MKWITRARPKIDRIACPWLVARFIDHDAISLGLSQTYPDDREMLKHGMVMYEALCAWCKSCQNGASA